MNDIDGNLGEEYGRGISPNIQEAEILSNTIYFTDMKNY
jgi:hypothetical protein